MPNEMSKLRELGFGIKLICWDRECSTKSVKDDRIDEIVTFNLKAPWGAKVLVYLPLWWFFAFKSLIREEYDIIHAINFDSAVPGVLAGSLLKKPVLYEILESYEDRIAFPTPIRSLLLAVDRWFMRRADAIVLADEAQNDEFNGIPNNDVVPIYDSSPDQFSGIYEINRDDNKYFTIFYAGALEKARKLNIDKLFEAVKDVSGVRVVIAGYGDLVEEIKAWSNKYPDKISFIGKISREEVFQRTYLADLTFVLRDTDIPQYKYICGSTFLGNIMCGTPLLVNKGTSTATKVTEERCGIVVDANDIGEIREAILFLMSHPDACREYRLNARNAYEQKYNWNIMQSRLAGLYGRITSRV